MNSSLTQTIDVSQYATAIDTGAVSYTLDGWLGGYSSQDDNSVLTVTFQDGGGGTLAMGHIGPVLAVDRQDATGLLERTAVGAVPFGTRTLTVVLAMTRQEGTANDGYADNLSLTFTGI
jgi:hypothetical protein